ncbi:Murein DD-endopeptidase MepS/Murein LD-carboxypeptidase precursor [Caloramator mitchellensis]|uniref:Murein DD-endopeptidase MepS/Murein LD-carboxypeptidase n=2 Tax=Caloramator mitchellensis TaxID=908809 RepID=A0A0R3JX66_CALMK|nr:Murein DD-endopeptidase MepS/Murein LD-carboxypeptidase precursor [Caloramator mitchellensis]
MFKRKICLIIVLMLIFSVVNVSAQTTKNSRDTRVVLSRGPQLVSYSKRFLGVKYVFGGQSTRGFDCSGFTSFAFKFLGYNLPHSAAEQYKMGLKISKNELLPGDLVFFETYKKGISHVGIYIGNGKFIHASSGVGYVTITKLSEAYYTKRYKGAARILR